MLGILYAHAISKCLTQTLEAVLHHYKVNYSDLHIVGEELEVKDKKTKIVYGEFDGLLIGANITIICEVKSNVIVSDRLDKVHSFSTFVMLTFVFNTC